MYVGHQGADTVLKAGATRPSLLEKQGSDLVTMFLDENGRDIWQDEFKATLQSLAAVQDAYLGLLRQAYRMQRFFRIWTICGDRGGIGGTAVEGAGGGRPGQ